jgi:glycosyltransferase involved in cell wall biosynthesis
MSAQPMASGGIRQRTILFEASNLGLAAGTGIATYARALASAAGRLGFTSVGLFDVARALDPREKTLNEVLAFDAIDPGQGVSPLTLALRFLYAPFNALGGLRTVELTQSGIVIEQATAALRAFNKVYAATRLIEAGRMHFKVYGRSAQLRLPQRASIFHATHPVPLAVKGIPNVVTIHDLVPLRLPFTTLDDKRYFYKLVQHIARTADHIVTVSEHSRRDIIDVLGVDEHRVTNTWQAVDVPPDIVGLSDDALASRLQALFSLQPREYYLFCGAIEPKKNVARLLDAYAASGTKRPLILAGGGGWQNSTELQKIDGDRFESYRVDGNTIRRDRQVRRFDYLPRDHLLILMRGAKALLFPSIYEGFGLPVVEAMALGTPVLTSNLSSLPEIAGEAALLVDPYSSDAISRGIGTLDADADICLSLSNRGLEQAKKFSPNAYDSRLARLYEAY